MENNFGLPAICLFSGPRKIWAPGCPAVITLKFEVSGFTIDWLVVLVFYSPSTYFRSFRARSVNLAHCSYASLLGSLPVLTAHSFASN